MPVSHWMTYALALALLTFSFRAAFSPRGAARAFGVPLADGTAPTPFLEVKANRDFVLAGLLVIFALWGQSILAAALFFGTIAPAADAWIVAHHGKLSGTVVHLGACVYMLVAGLLAASGH